MLLVIPLSVLGWGIVGFTKTKDNGYLPVFGTNPRRIYISGEQERRNRFHRVGIRAAKIDSGSHQVQGFVQDVTQARVQQTRVR